MRVWFIPVRSDVAKKKNPARLDWSYGFKFLREAIRSWFPLITLVRTTDAKWYQGAVSSYVSPLQRTSHL